MTEKEAEGLVIDADDEMGEELRRAQIDLALFTSAKTGKAKILHRWIRLLVAHVGALDVISEFCRHSSQNIDISLISVRSPPSRGTSIGDWKALIWSLASRPNGAGSAPVFDADHAIKEIESQIKLDHPDFTGCKIVKAFNLKPVTENAMQKGSQRAEANFVKFSGNRHCEATLAALASCFRENAPANGALSSLMKACPICVDRDVRRANCLYRTQTKR
jgi:hypothetical protein